jgi:hypothetical protein
VDSCGVDVVPAETLEQFVGVEAYRLDHTLLGVELLLDLLKNDKINLSNMMLYHISNHA